MKCFICLFGDEVRLYFIVLHPACSASCCWHLMTVLAKQRSPLALCCLRSRLPSPPSGLLRGRKPGWSQIIIQYSRNNSMIFPIPGGKKIGSHYLPRYTRYRVIAGRVIKGGHCSLKMLIFNDPVSISQFIINYILKSVQRLFTLAIKWARVRTPPLLPFRRLGIFVLSIDAPLTQLYKWIPGYRQWWKCECLVVARNCCMARMLPGEA